MRSRKTATLCAVAINERLSAADEIRDCNPERKNKKKKRGVRLTV